MDNMQKSLSESHVGSVELSSTPGYEQTENEINEALKLLSEVLESNSHTQIEESPNIIKHPIADSILFESNMLIEKTPNKRNIAIETRSTNKFGKRGNSTQKIRPASAVILPIETNTKLSTRPQSSKSECTKKFESKKSYILPSISDEKSVKRIKLMHKLKKSSNVKNRNLELNDKARNIWKKTNFALNTEKKQNIENSSYDLQSTKQDEYVRPKVMLEFFDNTEFESKTPQQWLEIGKSQGLPGTKACSRYFYHPEEDEEWEWAQCWVTNYDEGREMFEIEWIRTKKVQPKELKKYVKRLNLRFDEENFDRFYRRLEYAMKMKEDAEKKLDFHENVLKVDNAVVSPFANLEEALNSKMSVWDARKPAVLDSMEEIKREYRYCMKKSYYETKIGRESTNQENCSCLRFAEKALTLSGAKKDDPSGILQNQVAVVTKDLSTYMFAANSKVQKSIVLILASLREVLPQQESFFKANLEFPIPFNIFEERIVSQCELVQATLVYTWTAKIGEIIQNLLCDFFDFNETNPITFEKSRCKSFLNLIDLIMTSQLRIVITEGIQNFSSIFQISKYKANVKPKEISPLLFVIYLQMESASTARSNENPPNCRLTLFPTMEKIRTTLSNLIRSPWRLLQQTVPKMELSVMKLLKTQQSKNLNPQGDEPLIISADAEIQKLIREAEIIIREFINVYQKYDFLVQNNVYSEDIKNNMHLREIEENIQLYSEAYKQIIVLTIKLEVRPFIIDCSLVKQIYIQRAKQTLELLKGNLLRFVQKSSENLKELYSVLLYQILADPGTDAKVWNQLYLNKEVTIDKCLELEIQLMDLKQAWNILYDYQLDIPDKVAVLYWETCTYPLKIKEELSKANEKLQNSRILILEQIQIDKDHILSSVNAYTQIIQSFEKIGDSNLNPAVQEHMEERLRELRLWITQIENLFDSLNRREEYLQLKLTEIEQFKYLKTTFQFFETLWYFAGEICNLLQEWKASKFSELSSETIKQKILYWKDGLQILIMNFQNTINPLSVATALKLKLDSFCRYLVVIISLLNPALKRSHWERLSKTIGISSYELQNMTLKAILELDLELVEDIVADISEEASIELRLESSLEEMRIELSTQEFAVHLDPEYCIVKNFEEMLDTFEDQLIRTEALCNIGSTSGIIAKLIKWNEKLLKAQETILSWQNLQNLFVLLSPIFKNNKQPEIILKDDAESFYIIKKLMRILHDIAVKNRKVITVMLRTDIADMISSGASRLELIMKKISNFIEAKRHKFGILYLLSDSGYLDALSSLSMRKEVSRNIPKIFFNVREVVLCGGNRTAVGIKGLDDELIHISLRKLKALIRYEDLTLYHDIIKATFGEYQRQDVHAHLQLKIRDATNALLLNSKDEYFYEKTVQFYDMLLHFKSIILFGDAKSGKSSIQRVVEKLLIEENNSLKIFKIYPKAAEEKWISGHYDSRTGVWQEGILPSTLKKAQLFAAKSIHSNSTNPISSENLGMSWIVLDGPLDSDSDTSYLDSGSDGNQPLIFGSGESRYIHKNIRVIFETDSISSASPSLIQRSAPCMPRTT
ncbi:Dynein heavy chain 1, axonemal [Nowakowskiella sp. JEL0407]|nr:Dynein heavy chain 1, axonemal [Nowakowskiella sp. JEL0407]